PNDAQPIGLAMGWFDGDPRYLNNVHPDLAVVGLGGFVQILQNNSTPEGGMNFVVAQNIDMGKPLINVPVTGMGGNFQQDLAFTSPDDNRVYYLKNTSTAMDPATGTRGTISFDTANIDFDTVAARPIGLLPCNITGGAKENDLVAVNEGDNT